MTYPIYISEVHPSWHNPFAQLEYPFLSPSPLSPPPLILPPLPHPSWLNSFAQLEYPFPPFPKNIHISSLSPLPQNIHTSSSASNSNIVGVY